MRVVIFGSSLDLVAVFEAVLSVFAQLMGVVLQCSELSWNFGFFLGLGCARKILFL